MYKSQLAFLLFFLSSFVLLAQEDLKDDTTYAKTSLYFELLGTGGLYSLNVDRVLWHNEKLNLAARIGLTYIPIIGDFSNVGGPGIPVELSLFYGQNKNKLELGIGAAYHRLSSSTEKFHFLFVAPRIGYRHQKTKGGFFYRVAFTPLMPIVIDEGIEKGDIEPRFLPMLGFSIGHTLKR